MHSLVKLAHSQMTGKALVATSGLLLIAQAQKYISGRQRAFSMSKQKKIIIIAGPNGAGKTTFAHSFLAPLKDEIRFINADYIAAGLSPFDPELVAVRAGKIMLQEVQSCFERGESFAIETTLSGKGYGEKRGIT